MVLHLLNRTEHAVLSKRKATLFLAGEDLTVSTHFLQNRLVHSEQLQKEEIAEIIKTTKILHTKAILHTTTLHNPVLNTFH